ncbi:MAG: YheT family hydrolase [Hyphomicrobiaceae bacterium]
MLNRTRSPSPDLDTVPEFRERAPWWGGDLQTLRNQLVETATPLPSISQPVTFPTSDGSGDILTGMLETPRVNVKGPLIVLIHGLTGCTDSTYIRQTAKYHLERGHRVLRVNLRGAGSSSKSCSQYYHAGSAGNLTDILANIDNNLVSAGIFAIGFSLGGNILINLLARDCAPVRIIGAAAVSAPIVPIEAAQRLMAPRNWLYHTWLLRRMKKDYLGLNAHLGSDEEASIANACTIYQFDNDVIAPRNGFADADDYYANTAGMRVLSDIQIPTLLIHAENDPWIPATPYRKLKENCPANLNVVLASSGGHVGFHAKDAMHTWYDRLISRFLDCRLTEAT